VKSNMRGLPRACRPPLRRRAILQAARELYIQKGFQEVTVHDIAERAGVAQGTIYLYFKTKNHIYSAVWEHFLADLEERLRRINCNDSAQKFIQKAVEELAVLAKENDRFLAEAFGIGFRLCGVNNKVLRNRLFEIAKFLEQQMKRGIKDQSLYPCDAWFGALLLLSLMHIVALNRMLLPNQLSHVYVSGIMSHFFAKGGSS